MKEYICEVILVLVIVFSFIGSVFAECVPGRNICNIFGEDIARQYDAQQGRIRDLQTKQRLMEEILLRQKQAIEAQTDALRRENAIQEAAIAYKIAKDAEDAKQLRLLDGTANFSEDDNGAYCSLYGRCHSPALEARWKEEH